jgi:hypothetical protein
MKALTAEKKTDGQTYNRAKSDQDSVKYRQKTEPDFAGSGFHPPERFVPLLAKFSHPANATQRVQLFNQLQRHYGNRYVQRVVDAYRSENVEEEESTLASEILSKKGSGRVFEPDNLTVQGLFKSGAIQAKLKIGQPNDKYEQEADRVAEQVLRMPEPQVLREPEDEEEPIQMKHNFVQRHEEDMTKPISETIERQAGEEEEKKEEEEWIQKKPKSDLSIDTEDIEIRLDQTAGSGSPLPENIQEYMGSRFGYDFSKVKLHADGDAANLARSLSAQAFTIGKDVYFSSGKYDPNSMQGKKLIAHELTHVVQQKYGGEQQYIKRQKGPELPKGETPKTTKDPAKIAATVIKAFSKTEPGKRITKKLKEAGTPEVVIEILKAVPTIAISFAEKMEMPQGVVDLVPKIAKIEVGKDMEIAFQPIYKGRLGEKPKEWGGKVLFTIKRW